MDLTLLQLKALSKGDRDVFFELYKNYFTGLCLYAKSFSLDNEQAEDVVQDIFLRLYEDRKLFENVNSLKSYLYGAVRNGCLVYHRNEKRRRERENTYHDSLFDDRSLFEEIVESEVYRQLYLLLEELPPQCKNIFERVFNGQSSEQIAQEMNLSIETVKTQRKKAKRIIKEKFSALYTIIGIFL